MLFKVLIAPNQVQGSRLVIRNISSSPVSDRYGMVWLWLLLITLNRADSSIYQLHDVLHCWHHAYGVEDNAKMIRFISVGQGHQVISFY